MCVWSARGIALPTACSTKIVLNISYALTRCFRVCSIAGPAPSGAFLRRQTTQCLFVALFGPRRLGECPLRACACRKSNPNILVVQPAQDRAAKNGPGQFDGARDRRILLQR